MVLHVYFGLNCCVYFRVNARIRRKKNKNRTHTENSCENRSLTFPESLLVHILRKILWLHPYRATNRLLHLSSSLQFNLTPDVFFILLFSSQYRSNVPLFRLLYRVYISVPSHARSQSKRFTFQIVYYLFYYYYYFFYRFSSLCPHRLSNIRKCRIYSHSVHRCVWNLSNFLSGW